MSEENIKEAQPPQPGEWWVHPFKGVMFIMKRSGETACIARCPTNGETCKEFTVEDDEFAARYVPKPEHPD